MYFRDQHLLVDPVTGQIVAGESTENTPRLDGEPKLVKAIYTGTNGTQEGADDTLPWRTR